MDIAKLIDVESDIPWETQLIKIAIADLDHVIEILDDEDSVAWNTVMNVRQLLNEVVDRNA